MSKPDVTRIAGTIGRGGRSKLYRWLWDNFDEVKAAKVGKPDWVDAAREFTALGFKARGDRALSPDAVRKTWQRVEADRARSIVAPQPKPPPIGAAVRPRPEIPPPPDDDAFQLVSVKKGVPDGQ